MPDNKKPETNPTPSIQGLGSNDLLASLYDRCCKFEEEKGFEEFIKLGASAMNRLLVEKGLVTEDEIKWSVMRELDQRELSS